MADLTDTELVGELRKLGYSPPGPITHTTRCVYQNKLRRLSAGSVGDDPARARGTSTDTKVKPEQALGKDPPIHSHSRCTVNTNSNNSEATAYVDTGHTQDTKGACNDQVTNGKENSHSQTATKSDRPSSSTKSSQSSKDIFISYGRGTVKDIAQLKKSLESKGYSVWLDKSDIPGGSDWHSAIGTALRECKAIVALISTKYLTSKYCKNELYMGNSLNKHILPVLLDSDVIDDPGVSFVIASPNWIRAVDNFDTEKVASQLVQGLKELCIYPSIKEQGGEVVKSLREYTVEEVCKFIHELEINPEPFRDNSVNGRDLLHLTDKDMMGELQLKPLQIKKLKREIKAEHNVESTK